MTNAASMATDVAAVDWKSIALGAISLITVLFGILYHGLRTEVKELRESIKEQIKSQETRLSAIEKSNITREELHAEIEDVVERIDERHRQYRDLIGDIARKIDLNEKVQSKTRHDIRDSVNALVIQMAVLQDRLKKDMR